MARTALRKPDEPRRIGLVAWPDFQSLDVVGPLEVFATASRLALLRGACRHDPYRTEVIASEPGPLRASSGLVVHADRSWRSARGPFDTVLIAGGTDTCMRRALADRAFLRWVVGLERRTRRLGSVCSGAFVLAAAGLLDGRRATTHWDSVELLAERFPLVDVEPDAIFVRDGRFVTSAGVTAGMDLALSLVEEDLGRELALAVARQLVVFLKRPGGQSQFSAELQAQASARGPLEGLPDWISGNLAADLGVEALAAHVAMSPRHFARVFRDQFGTTPARFVERARIERARRALEECEATLDDVAGTCGFGSTERMRRAFARTLGVVPNAYRQRFAVRSEAGT